MKLRKQGRTVLVWVVKRLDRWEDSVNEWKGVLPVGEWKIEYNTAQRYAYRPKDATIVTDELLFVLKNAAKEKTHGNDTGFHRGRRLS
jgi:hypothetical protein